MNRGLLEAARPRPVRPEAKTLGLRRDGGPGRPALSKGLFRPAPGPQVRPVASTLGLRDPAGRPQRVFHTAGLLQEHHPLQPRSPGLRPEPRSLGLRAAVAPDSGRPTASDRGLAAALRRSAAPPLTKVVSGPLPDIEPAEPTALRHVPSMVHGGAPSAPASGRGVTRSRGRRLTCAQLEDRYFVLEGSNCDVYRPMLCAAYRMILANYDIVSRWFTLSRLPEATLRVPCVPGFRGGGGGGVRVPGRGREFRKHFDGRIRTHFQCRGIPCVVDPTGLVAQAVPPGILLCPNYMNTLWMGWQPFGRNTHTRRLCIASELAALILHETYHLTGHTSENTADGLEFYFLFFLRQRLGNPPTTGPVRPAFGPPQGGTYCCFVPPPPVSGVWCTRPADGSNRCR